jgi:hypothetical protein
MGCPDSQTMSESLWIFHIGPHTKTQGILICNSYRLKQGINHVKLNKEMLKLCTTVLPMGPVSIFTSNRFITSHSRLLDTIQFFIRIYFPESCFTVTGQTIVLLSHDVSSTSTVRCQ